MGNKSPDTQPLKAPAVSSGPRKIIIALLLIVPSLLVGAMYGHEHAVGEFKQECRAKGFYRAGAETIYCE